MSRPTGSINLATINRQIRSQVSKHLELERGTGYQYFIFDDGEEYETHSVMVPRLSHQTLDQWISDAKAFFEDLNR